MSSSVSQLQFWREASSDNTNEKKGVGGEGAAYLSYDILMGLSVLGGFFALDHLYLRSPLTFIAKFIVNILCFGVWWIYDACQVIFNSQAVKMFGLGVPGLGPKGIAAGVFANPVPDKKHLQFFIYAASLIFGGVFGLDSFVVGDNRTGFIRLICLISVVLAPVALCWWAYNLFNFFTDTKTVVAENSDFFGAPAHSFKSRFLSKIPFIGALFSPMETIKTAINDIVGDAILPITDTVQAAIKTADDAVMTVGKVANTGKAAIEKSSEIVGQVSNVVDKVSQASQVLPGTSMYASITPATLQQEINKEPGMAGGAAAALVAASSMDLNTTHYLLIVTFVTIILGGVIVTYHRAKNVPEERDDSPPVPGVFREPDQKSH